MAADVFIIFWGGLWIVAVASIAASAVTAHLRHREAQKTLRHALDKGAALDPAALEAMARAQSPRQNRMAPDRQVLVAGVVMLALGIGVFVGSWISGADAAGPWMRTGGLIVGLVGGGLLGVVRFLGPASDARG